MSAFLATRLARIDHRPEAAFDYPLLVEITGPATAGKSTLARVLADQLSGAGHPVTVVSSARPAELAPDHLRPSALGAALSRASKLFDIAQHDANDDVGSRLLALMPPRHRLWTLRYRRYLAELGRAWTSARASGSIVIFDQAYLSAAVALAVLTREPAGGDLDRALDLVPLPDLTVRLEVPRQVLERRLAARLARQGLLERLFELDVPTTLRQVDGSRDLAPLLAARGARLITAENAGDTPPESLARSVATRMAAIRGVLAP